ncbi:hypothetical protein ACTXT7_002089 [Hymenolepis weldensis]
MYIKPSDFEYVQPLRLNNDIKSLGNPDVILKCELSNIETWCLFLLPLPMSVEKKASQAHQQHYLWRTKVFNTAIMGNSHSVIPLVDHNPTVWMTTGNTPVDIDTMTSDLADAHIDHCFNFSLAK